MKSLKFDEPLPCKPEHNFDVGFVIEFIDGSSQTFKCTYNEAHELGAQLARAHNLGIMWFPRRWGSDKVSYTYCINPSYVKGTNCFMREDVADD